MVDNEAVQMNLKETMVPDVQQTMEEAREQAEQTKARIQAARDYIEGRAQQEGRS